MIRASYSAALFEMAEVSVKEYGIIASSGVTNITPAPALSIFGEHRQNTFAMWTGPL